MSEILSFMQEHAKIIVQIFGVIMICCGFSNTKVILAKSGTYWDYNPKLAAEFIKEDYDKILGLFLITLPEIIFQFGLSYLWAYFCMAVGLVLIIPYIRNYFVKKREQKIAQLLKNEEKEQ